MSTVEEMMSASTDDFVRFLKSQGIERCYFVWNQQTQTVVTSHPALEPIAEFLINDKRDYHHHEGVFLALCPKTDTLMGAFIHGTCRGQAQGGTRFWQYDKLEDFFRDGLRLSLGMTRKNALAGLWWGGGKGVIARSGNVDASDDTIRKAVFNAYGEFTTSLKGAYITAEDVGTKPVDVSNIFESTRYVTCIPPETGGSGNPSFATARGVLAGMKAALTHKQQGSLQGKKVAVQGAGHVGAALIGLLVEEGAKVVVSDITEGSLQAIADKHGDAVETRLGKIGDNSILFEDADIVAPCATGAIINPGTIEQLKTGIICGAANNQLEDAERDGNTLIEKNIIYVPDFIVNRMGIVQCANEQYGYVNDDPILEQHLSEDWQYSIHQTVLQVLRDSESSQTPSALIARDLADELAKETHPIFGHRTKLIIESLISNNWQK